MAQHSLPPCILLTPAQNTISQILTLQTPYYLEHTVVLTVSNLYPHATKSSLKSSKSRTPCIELVFTPWFMQILTKIGWQYNVRYLEGACVGFRWVRIWTSTLRVRLVVSRGSNKCLTVEDRICTSALPLKTCLRFHTGWFGGSSFLGWLLLFPTLYSWYGLLWDFAEQLDVLWVCGWWLSSFPTVWQFNRVLFWKMYSLYTSRQSFVNCYCKA